MPGTVVKILVEGHTEWSGEFTVKPNGMVFIPGFGEIRAEGMSKAKFETELTRSLERYINNPMATVDIVKYASEVIYILGEVGRPGEYSTGGKTITLRDAVILAGLPTSFAATSRVYIISPSSEKPNQRVVNLYRILYRGELERNIEVRPGEIVYVPKTVLGMISDLVGAIFNPLSTARTAGVTTIP
jgi:polysaccharide export outer membrane protein